MESGRSGWDWLSMPINRSQVEGAGLAFILACAGIFFGLAGLGVASNACTKTNGKCPTQQFGCVFDTITKTGCQTGNCITAQDTYRGPITGQDLNCFVTFPNSFSTPPKSIDVQFSNDTQILCNFVCTTAGGYSGYGFETIANEEFFAGSSITITAMPSGITPFNSGNSVSVFDVSACNIIYLETNVIIAGSASAVLRIQYSPAGYGGSATGPWANLFTTSANDLSIATTGFQFIQPIIPSDIPKNATIGNFGGIFLRLVTLGGNGIASPQLGLTQLQCLTLFPAMNPFGYKQSTVSTTGFQIVSLASAPFISTVAPPPNEQSVRWYWTWTAFS